MPYAPQLYCQPGCAQLAVEHLFPPSVFTHRVGLYPVEVKPAGSQSAIGCIVDGQARCDLQQCCSQPSVHSHEPLVSYNGAQGMCYPSVVL